MKKRTIFFFLVSLCLVGSGIYLYGERVAHPDSHQLGPPGPDAAYPGSSGEPAPVVIYGELKKSEFIEKVEIEFWPKYLDELAKTPAPFKEVISTTKGNVFTGSAGTATFEYHSPEISAPAWISIKSWGATYFNKFLVYPGDSVRFRYDLVDGKILFAGPDALKFQCQYEINQALENWNYRKDTFLPVTKSSVILKDEKDSLEYWSLINNGSSVKRKMLLLYPDDQRLEFMKDLLEEDLFSHPGFSVLENYRNLPEEFLQLMEAQLIGSYLYRKVSIFGRLYHDDPRFAELLTTHVLPLSESHFKESTIAHSPAYLDYIFEKNTLISAIQKKPAVELYSHYSPLIRDLLYGRYMVRYYRKFKESNKSFEKALEVVETPWIAESIASLYKTQKTGEQVTDIPLRDLEGNEVSLLDYQGKTLFVDFWFSGCSACIKFYKNYLTQIEAHFEGDEEFAVVSISSDRDSRLWKKSIASGNFTSDKAINLNAPGADHPLIQYYNIQAYPTHMLINKRGEVARVGNFPTDLDQLINMLEFYKSN
ncbi:TlpA family protein disulfide reductase [Litoribacter populi]|uniref:TlpA family protein disulfide reductase n=1 Tax=Litoribacter populi TaxID=2598460 RepID=UPI001181383D|nr:TlpA disulfide reductase family protein [Litoribacter populi]